MMSFMSQAGREDKDPLLKLMTHLWVLWKYLLDLKFNVLVLTGLCVTQKIQNKSLLYM